jgi:hypothetical protein
VFYTHAVWTLDLAAYFGEQSWLSREVIAQANRDGYSWSVLSWCRSSTSLWAMHIVALGMPTFGLAMLIANVSFISPRFLRVLIDGPDDLRAERAPAFEPPTKAATSLATPHFSRRKQRDAEFHSPR